MLAFPPDLTFVVQLVSFFVLLAILNRLLFAPFTQLLDERVRRTRGARTEAERDEAVAKELARRVEEDLNQARVNALAEAEALRRAAREREAEIFNEAKSAAAARLADLRAGIARERDQAMRTLRDEAQDLAAAMVEAVLASPRRG